jgi:hypothetical protein
MIVVVVVDDIEQQSVVEMKNDDVGQVLTHMDDVDDDRDEDDDVEEIIRFVLNYSHDDNFLVFQYLIEKKQISNKFIFLKVHLRVAVKP